MRAKSPLSTARSSRGELVDEIGNAMQALVSRGMILTVAERARELTIELKCALPRYFVR
jgi:hypothetical protein